MQSPADALGNWIAWLAPLAASSIPRSLKIATQKSILIEDVLVGEVWVCAGQSNMQRRLGPVADQKPVGGWKEAVEKADFSGIRFFVVEERFAPEDSQPDSREIQGKWRTCNPESAPDFPAVPFFFARDLHEHFGVPVGVVVAAVGGSPIEAWMSRDSLASAPGGLEILRRSSFFPHEQPAAIFHGMLAPLAPFSIRGFLWYQGESNRSNPAGYEARLAALISEWRLLWSRPELPFLFVEIPGHCDVPPELRDAQRKVHHKTAHTAMVSIIDHGDAEDFHPAEKAPVGRRLALAARAVAHGEPVLWCGPVPSRAEMEENAVVLHFNFGAGGLDTSDGGTPREFELAGEDRLYHSAQTKLLGDRLALWCGGIRRARWIRHGWKNVPAINLINTQGMPAGPFEFEISEVDSGGGNPDYSSQEKPAGLLVNLLSKPEKTLITKLPPRFSWIVPQTTPGDFQTARQILVASCMELLKAGSADLWDSGKIDDGESLHVPYQGTPLHSGQFAWWTVRTWNRDGKESAFATPQCFCIGNLNRSGELWPGQSRWVRMPSDVPEGRWTFEDRHPVSYHARQAVKTVEHSDGTTFLDFGRTAFSCLKLTLDWTPRMQDEESANVEVVIGEKCSSSGERIDDRPGGGVIFRRYPLVILPGTRDYKVQFPRFVPKYPHSQAMPPHMPEVVPFRCAEIRPGNNSVRVVSGTQLALWVEFNDEASQFSSSSAKLDAVYELCKYSLKVNSFNGDFASSERERMMYEADTFIQQLGHYAVDREFAIARYSVENMLHHGSWPTEWISHCLLMVWADYWHTGDPSLLIRHYETLKPKTLTALAREDGLISTRTGLQDSAFLQSIHAPVLRDIVDWPSHMADNFEFRDYNAVVNAFHYQSLVLMGKIAGVVGNEADAHFYAERAAQVRAAFQKEFFDSDRGLVRDGIGSGHHSFHANLFAIAFDLVPASLRTTILNWLKSRGMACGVYPSQYVLEVFFDHMEAEHAIALLTSESDRSWLNMLRMGSTVTTEAWDMKYKHNISWTHAWSSPPAHIIPRKLMGIEPASPGYRHVRIRPQPGSLERAAMILPTIRGGIHLCITNSASEPFRIDLTLPANTTATVILPTLGFCDDSVEWNGKIIHAVRNCSELVILDVPSGNHRFLRKRS